MIGQHYNHTNGDVYEVLDTPDGKLPEVGWVKGVYYKSTTTGKTAWSPADRFKKKFSRNIFSEKLAKMERNADICDPEEILS